MRILLSIFLIASLFTGLLAKDKEIKIASIEALHDYFEDVNYTSATWKAGLREIPRIYFSDVTSSWKKTSNKLPVKEKKNIFFRLLAPLVLMSNEAILKERALLLKANKNSKNTIKLAKKYRVINKDATHLNDEQYNELVKRVDIVPLSLSLAQGAEESGWGTSRFTSEGNAFFGLWDYSGKGMAPKQQRKSLGNYGLARYKTPLASVEGYMFNINIGHAYKDLRELRASLRQKNEKITGYALANTLLKYSERGQKYVDGLHSMMRYNKLNQADNAYLSTMSPIHLVKE